MHVRHAGWALVVASIFCCSGAEAALAPVQIESGLLEGVEADGVAVYRGIPFAAPPVGALRWRAPEPAHSWPGTRRADSSSPVCLQHGSYPADAPAEEGSEDCLYLNVWAPLAATDRKLPVMVWIHGGGLRNGSASTPLYAGDRLARRGVLVVTANYRLGVFGFLAHPELTQESVHHSSGNYGLQDQIAALAWVHRNIAAFGGDPERVTVFGQSSGAISISALMASPLTKGLFQRAIAQSGGLFEPMDLGADFTLPGAEEDGQSFAARAGARSLPALRAMPAAELLKVPSSARLIIDGHVLTRPPYDVFREGRQADIPVLIGSNSDEGTYFIVGRTITVANYRAELGRSFPPFLVRLAAPDPGVADAQARAAAVVFNRDMRFGWDMWTWARLTAQREGARVFVYEFSRASPEGSAYAGMGATHGAEMPYVFDHLDQQAIAWAPADRALASAMSAYWTNFAKTGDPNGAGLPRWPTFTESAGGAMLLGDRIEPGRPFDEPSLNRIDRVYSVARFTFRNGYALLAVVGVLVIGGLVLLVRRFRRKRHPSASRTRRYQ